MKKKVCGLLAEFWSKIEPNPKVDKDILEFHSDQVELDDQPAPRIYKATLYTVVCIVLVTLFWSIIAKVDRVVVAEGKITSSAQPITVHPLETSIIKSFDVSVGDIVQTGQVLVRLDPTFSQADHARLQQREKSTALQMARLRSELDPAEQFRSVPGVDSSEMKVQMDLYKGRREEYAFRMEVYDNTLSELKAAKTSLETQLAESIKQLDILKRIEGIYKNLYAQKHQSLADYLNAQYTRASKTAEIARLGNDIDEKGQALLKTMADKNAYSSKWKNDILVELTSLGKEHDAIKEELAKASKMHELSVLTAPSPGVVLELGPFSAGSVAKYGDPVMVLVPLDAPLEAEIYVDSSDIGYVRTGDACRIKLATFPFQKHGTLTGKIRTISNDSLKIDEKSEPKYKTRVTLVDTKLQGVPDDYRLFPGMSLRAEVKVGTRRVITFFTYPLLRVLDQGLRDP